MERTVFIYYPSWHEYSVYLQGKTEKVTLEEWANYKLNINFMIQGINDALDILSTYYAVLCNRRKVTFKSKLVYYPDHTLMNDTEKDAIRVCICFKDIEYHESLDLFKAIVRNTSHLVCLIVDTRREKFEWQKNTEAPFDAVIFSNEEYLEYIIFSIVYDIVLYNIYGLPQDKEYRKSFSCIKNKFIKEEFKQTYAQETYGADVNDDVYIPLSLGTILNVRKMSSVCPDLEKLKG
ncbi:MAG: hypothetical protein LBI54_02935 [Lachnospiraceae bacterium]|jgi:hypothetical protein|nr:hypothetical protein [Lachnospiraceae bacterium]